MSGALHSRALSAENVLTRAREEELRQDFIERSTAMLLQAAQTAKMTISGDLRVSEKDAAQLLGYAPGYLKNMRQEGNAPHHYKRGVSGSRISYRLSDIATWIEERREDW